MLLFSYPSASNPGEKNMSDLTLQGEVHAVYLVEYPDSKVHGAIMGPTMNFANWDSYGLLLVPFLSTVRILGDIMDSNYTMVSHINHSVQRIQGDILLP